MPFASCRCEADFIPSLLQIPVDILCVRWPHMPNQLGRELRKENYDHEKANFIKTLERAINTTNDVQKRGNLVLIILFVVILIEAKKTWIMRKCNAIVMLLFWIIKSGL